MEPIKRNYMPSIVAVVICFFCGWFCGWIGGAKPFTFAAGFIAVTTFLFATVIGVMVWEMANHD